MTEPDRTGFSAGPSAKMPERGSMVHQIAERIREDVFGLDDDAFLGSEDDLILRYGASRPTVRQAAGLIVREQLLSVRRGVGGGFFARRPDTAVVTHIVALYLRAHGVALPQVTTAVTPIRVEIARLAAHSSDAVARAALARFLEDERASDAPLTFERFVGQERAFNHHLATLGGNPALALFLDILIDISSIVHREDDMYRGYNERMKAYQDGRLRLAEAVLEKDEEVAVLWALRCARMSQAWLNE